MNERDIIKQLHSLKQIEPDSNWQAKNREILYSQVFSQSTAPQNPESLFASLSAGLDYAAGRFSAVFLQPAWVAASIILVFTLSIGGSVYASRNAKPGDSLYVAKMISEKAHLAVTFNETEKAKLGVTFAGNRAKEITQILAEPSDNKEAQAEQVKQLESDFKKEISTVITRLSKAKVAKQTPENEQPAENNQEEKSNPEEIGVFGANLGKDNKRMEIFEQQKTEPITTVSSEAKPQAAEAKPSQQSTSTEEAKPATAKPAQIEKVLQEAEKLLIEEKNIQGSLDKLDEAKVIINNPESKAAGETDATSTQK